MHEDGRWLATEMNPRSTYSVEKGWFNVKWAAIFLLV